MLTAASTQEYLLAYLQWLDADRAGLPDPYREPAVRGARALRVDGLDRTPELDAAVVWMFRSFSRVGELVPVVMSILARRLRAGAVLAPLADAEMRARLDRLARLARAGTRRSPSWPATCGSATSTSRCSRRWSSGSTTQTERVLDAARGRPGRPRTRHRGRRGWCDLPTRSAGALLRRLARHRATRGSGEVLLEVYARRYYRTRELRDLRFDEHDGQLLCAADYDWENKHMHLVVGYAPLDRLPAAGRRGGRRTWSTSPRDRTVVVDLATWRAGRSPDDEAAAPWRRCWPPATSGVPLAGGRHCDQHRRGGGRALPHPAPELPADGRRPGRGGPALPQPAPDARQAARPVAAGELPRSSGWPRAEDVYLFHGVAHENPKDHRLFALAEVRDLTPVRRHRRPSPTRGWAGWACRRWPRCARPWSATRRGIAPRRTASCSTCGRPGTLPRRVLAGARRARSRRWPTVPDLEKVLLRVRLPGGRRRRDEVLDVAGRRRARA